MSEKFVIFVLVTLHSSKNKYVIDPIGTRIVTYLPDWVPCQLSINLPQLYATTSRCTAQRGDTTVSLPTARVPVPAAVAWPTPVDLARCKSLTTSKASKTIHSLDECCFDGDGAAAGPASHYLRISDQTSPTHAALSHCLSRRQPHCCGQ